MKITLDTNIIPADPTINSADGLGYDFKVTSVTDRELKSFDRKAELPSIYETAVWGESCFGSAVFAS